MKILLLHNYYQLPGGEDLVVQQEKALLEARGHTVILLALSNDSITSARIKIKVAFKTIYSPTSRVQVSKTIAEFSPDIVHVHNFFPRLSPSVYYSCSAARVPVVQTLHNFRLICPNALLFREGNPCELCVGKLVAWPGIIHGCYRHSHLGSAVVATMLGAHQLWGTWKTAVDAYITLSEFARQKLIAGGLPSSRLFVKPNCLAPDPGQRKRADSFALFVGRLSPEKGIKTLLAAWSHLPGRKLKIVGDGPLREAVEKAGLPDIKFLGRQSSGMVLDLIGSAAFLVLPSECYENFPRVIVEAFAKGVPVLGSRLGSTAELIDEGLTGMLFVSGDAKDLARKAEWLYAHPDELQQMSNAARNEYETKYTADRNYAQLMEIYRSAAEVSKQRYAHSMPTRTV
ncbi:MAG TPA: glycosyltransferase [Terriglobales bacterium]|jgi:glycosyltransferase involved in cell wall biosynthesis